MSPLGQKDVAPEVAAAAVIDLHAQEPEWLDAFIEALERQRAGRELERVLRVWGLSKAEAGRVFGVSRQAVTKWLHDGVPTQRLEQLADLSAATDVLVRALKRDRIPAVVRRAAPGLGGRSLLDLLAAGETPRLLEAARAMFAFGDAHR